MFEADQYTLAVTARRSGNDMDWASRKVLTWRLSNTMDTEFCVAALEEAIARHGRASVA